MLHRCWVGIHCRLVSLHCHSPALAGAPSYTLPLLMADPLLALSLAWERWDRQPTHEHAAIALEVEVQLYAKRYGTTGSKMHDDVGQLRQGGMSLRDALEQTLTTALT